MSRERAKGTRWETAVVEYLRDFGWPHAERRGARRPSPCTSEETTVTDIQLTVLGVAAPQGSKRHVGHGRMVESSKRVGPWREAIVAEAHRQDAAGLMLDEPLLVTIIVTLPRPAGHYGTGRNRAQVKASAPAYPAGKPDVDKLARSCMDGLVQAGVVVDDARVVSLHARKVWALPGAAPATHISVHGVTS